MKYSFNIWPYTTFPIWAPSYPMEETIKRLSKIGYDGMEVGCAAPHAWPYYLDSARRKELKALMDQNKIKVSSMLAAPGGGPGANPASIYKEERLWTIQHYKDIIDLAVEWECPSVIYLAGWMLYGTREREALKLTRDSLSEIAQYALGKKITMMVEPQAADCNLIEGLDDAINLMNDVNMPNIKLMFDICHVLYRNEVPTDYIYTMGENLKHVHITDTDRMPPGKGTVDFVPIMQALKDVGYTGYVTMEIAFTSRAFQPDTCAAQALQHLKGIEKNLK